VAHHIDLNCDIGESYGAWSMGHDEAVMEFVTSANVACGFHAGDPVTMRLTVERARRAGVAVGAHPGFPDRLGFGRRAMAVTPDEAYAMTLYQIGALDAIARAAGTCIRHVKPHGALYNAAARDAALADAIAAATRDAGAGLTLVGQPSSELERGAERAGVRFAAEVFADRTYLADGSLTPRGRPDAFVRDSGEAAARIVGMLREGNVEALTGERVPIRADTVCLHGDNPEAVEFARAVRTALDRAGIEVRALEL
jgi:UPF0271 protein